MVHLEINLNILLPILIIVFGAIVWWELSHEQDSKGFGSCVGAFAFIVCLIWAVFAFLGKSL